MMGRKDEQVTPFNAGDPIMPGDEPVTWTAKPRTWGSRRTDDNPSPFLDADETSAENPAAEHAVETSVEETSMPFAPAAESAAPAPATRQPSSEANARELRRLERKLEDARRRKARKDARVRRARQEQRELTSKSKGNSKIGWLIALLIILGVFAGSLEGIIDGIFDAVSGFTDDPSYSLDYDDSDADAYDDFSYDVGDYEVEAESTESFKALTEEQTESLLADFASENSPYLEQVAERFKSEFRSFMGFDPEDVGIESTSVASWMLSNVSYEIDSVFAFGSGTEGEYDCTAYFDATSVELYLSLYDLSAYASNEHDILSADDLADKSRTAIREEFERLQEKASTGSHYASISFTGSFDENGDPVLELDQENWEAEMYSILGLY